MTPTRFVQAWFAISTIVGYVASMFLPDMFISTPVSVAGWLDAAISLVYAWYFPALTESFWAGTVRDWRRRRQLRMAGMLSVVNFNVIGCNVFPVSLVMGIVPSVFVSLALAVPIWLLANMFGVIWSIYRPGRGF